MHYPNSSRARRARNLALAGVVATGTALVGVGAASAADPPPYVTPVTPASQFQWTSSKTHNHTIQLMSIAPVPGQPGVYYWTYEVSADVSDDTKGKINKWALGMCSPDIQAADSVKGTAQIRTQISPEEWKDVGAPNIAPFGNWFGNLPYGAIGIEKGPKAFDSAARTYRVPITGAWNIDTTHMYSAIKGSGGSDKGDTALLAAPGCNRLVDLGIAKIVTSGASVVPGGTVSYTVTVTNNGWWDIPRTALEVTDPGATLTADPTDPDVLAVGASFTWTATKTVPENTEVCGTEVTNTATVTVTGAAPPSLAALRRLKRSLKTNAKRSTGTQVVTPPTGYEDPVPGNDSATAAGVTVAGGICTPPTPPPPVTPPETPVTPAGTPTPTGAPAVIVGLRPPGPALSVSKTGPARVLAGGIAAYRITLTNIGDATATGVKLRDLVPPGMTLVGKPSGSSVSGKNVRWTLGDLAPNASVSATVRLRASRTIAGRRCNLARATSTNAAQVQDAACTTVRSVVGQRPPVTG